MNQINIVFKKQINDLFYTLSKYLYLLITAIVQDFNILIQIFQKKINEMDVLLSKLPNNKTLSNTKK